jgi:Fe-S-cluster containining protein
MNDKPHEANKCADCCCARSWRALGLENSPYTGKSIPEHISELVAALRQLHDECVQAGHDRDRDFNWPKAMADACSALQRD